MPKICVTVYRDGKPVDGHRVTLSYDGMLTGGMSSPEYTNSSGQAYFDSNYGDGGEVYVDGQNKEKWGSYSKTNVHVYL